MRLEDQVVSLEIAKRLKELGVKQDSNYYWIPFNDGTSDLQFDPNGEMSKVLGPSAFTVAELGEMLPVKSYSFKIKDGIFACTKPLDMKMALIKELQKVQQADTEANARGKMLIYLLENGLIK